jgi:uracil-DNA glycosylase family protein
MERVSSATAGGTDPSTLVRPEVLASKRGAMVIAVLSATVATATTRTGQLARRSINRPLVALQRCVLSARRNRHERSTQAVFGRGSREASVMLIGEQPGDAEDRKGEPFVGPAGQLLARALHEAQIPPAAAYTTNAVKHFRWKPDPRGGKRHIHERPDSGRVRACRPWLDGELVRLDPQVIVTLGAIAGQALFGNSFRVTARRGEVISWTFPATGGDGSREIEVVPTIHPSAVLRADDRDAALAGLVADLKVAAATLAEPG